MARPRRVAAKRTVDKVKEQLAGDEDLKEYNVKSEDTNESSSGSEEEMRVVQQGRKNTRNFPRKSTAEVAGMGSWQTDVKKLQKITSRKRKNVSVHEESEDNMHNGFSSDSNPSSSSLSQLSSSSDSEISSSSDSDHDSATTSEEVAASGKKKNSVKKKVTVAARNSRAAAKKVKKRGRGRGLWNNVEGVAELDWEVWEHELESTWGPWGDNDSDLDMEALVQRKLPMEQREPPSELLMPLLPFQKEWLAWSLKQERSEMCGGILADEMGMGKTIQAISLIVTSRFDQKTAPSLRTAPSRQLLKNVCDSKRDLPQVKATLVVCPLVAVIQWRNEIARFTAEGSMKVLVYHGPRRGISFNELANYDIVLTTYSIVELEHRKNVMPSKQACQWCRRLYYPDKLAIHLRYFCGPDAQRTEKQAKQMVKKPRTLKGSLAAGKVSESEGDDIDKSSKIGRSRGAWRGRGGGRGRGRKIAAEDLGEALQEALKTVITTSEDCKGNSILHSVKWGRIVLDEAHFIKDRRCSTAKAIFALQSQYKWALSGTPLQNRVGELYSLVRFLEIYPYSYYFCRACDCKSLDYRWASSCDGCGHSPLHHFCWWNKFIASPIKKWGYVHEGRKAMMLLKYKVLDSTLLRRTKTERAADLALPPRTTYLRRDAFDTREEDFYQALYTQSQSQFNTYVTAGTLVNNYAHIFDLLTRLRQAVDHPYLVVYSATAAAAAREKPLSYNAAAEEEACGICHDPAEDSVRTGCCHTFCRLCIQEYITAAGEPAPQCPTCQKPLTVDFTGTKSAEAKEKNAKDLGYKRTSILSRIDLDQFQTSTKIDALREEINLMLKRDAAAKGIVFSQFTSMLDLIGFCLQKSGIKCVKLDGSMSMHARDVMIERFTNDPDCKVFLMSLKAGGVALNLTVASHVFLMDPWWNPAVEQQAQDRIHRLGQYKPIKVTRFVIENTIEERILKLQEKKQLVFEGTVGGSAEALGRLTEDDLRFLFTN
ncbi:unnamed protein product [Sphagnum jensenii]|uniref:DNA repair protein RAD16 n=1 Tax=Sphagnum jensenii TaxID=128206 RepID=A0ABP0W295_9BRYO